MFMFGNESNNGVVNGFEYIISMEKVMYSKDNIIFDNILCFFEKVSIIVIFIFFCILRRLVLVLLSFLVMFLILI